MTNRPYQVTLRKVNKKYPYVRYFSDFKSAYSFLRKHILHSIYYKGHVTYVAFGIRPIVHMKIVGDYCYRWFGRYYLFHPSEVFQHHKSPKFLVGDYHA